MSEQKEVIGIIAGGGQFPLMVADSIRKQGHRVVAVAHREETDPELEKRVDQIVWIRLGQMGQLIKALKKHGVQKALLAGTIAKRLMFKIKPDLTVSELTDDEVFFPVIIPVCDCRNGVSYIDTNGFSIGFDLDTIMKGSLCGCIRRSRKKKNDHK